MRIRFWGVRGTIPTPGPDTVRLGGNTACIDILTTDHQLIIIDAGSGIRRLGMALEVFALRLPELSLAPAFLHFSVAPRESRGRAEWGPRRPAALRGGNARRCWENSGSPDRRRCVRVFPRMQ